MNCTDVLDLFDDHLEGDLSDAARRTVDEHLRGCDACRSEFEALEDLLAAARSLDTEQTPPEGLWPAIRRGIEAQRVVAFPPRQRRFAALAAAVVFGFVALVAAYHLGRSRSEPVVVEVQPTGMELASNDADRSLVPASFSEARRELRTALEARRDSLSAETIAMIETNLAVIDSAIAEITAALDENPDDPQLQRQLFFACSQEINLLQRATTMPAEI